MSKLAGKIAVVVAVGILVVPTMADFSSPAMPVHITRTAGHFSGSGGEFTMVPGMTLGARVTTGTVSDLSGGGSWQAFCVEKNEYVKVPGDYYADINTFSAGGGVGGHDGNQGPNGTSSDTLDPRTAYLYQNFRLGTLQTPYSYGVGRAADAGALQDVIWYIEGETGSISGKAVTLFNEAVEATEIGTMYDGTAADGQATWIGIGNVRIANMWALPDHTGNHQDQLAMIPAPGAGLLGVIGLGAVAAIRRRVG